MTRTRRTQIRMLLGAVTAGCILGGTTAAAAQQGIGHRTIHFDRLGGGANRPARRAAAPPAIAADADQLDELWDRYGFTISEGGLPGQPWPPPPPPEVGFPDEVAIFLVTGGRVTTVVRDGGVLVVDLDVQLYQGPADVGIEVRIVGVARDDLPPPPFVLVQRENGQDRHRILVDERFEVSREPALPETGAPALALVVAGALCLGTGGAVLRRSRRRTCRPSGLTIGREGFQ